MNQVVRAFPVLEGQESALREFARELRGARAKQASEFYSRFGVSRESWHLQETPHGAWVIGITEISEQEMEQVASSYARSTRDFDHWFKSRVEQLTGVNPNETPLGPPTECIFDTAEFRETG